MSQFDNKEKDETVFIAFDLSQEKLKTYYTGAHYKDAYKDIRKYLTHKGFTGTGDSDYVNNDIDTITASWIVRDFSLKNKWFPASSKKVIIGTISATNLSMALQDLRDDDWEKQMEQIQASQAEKSNNAAHK